MYLMIVIIKKYEETVYITNINILYGKPIKRD